MIISAFAFCSMVISLTIIIKSWYDCGSDHIERDFNGKTFYLYGTADTRQTADDVVKAASSMGEGFHTELVEDHEFEPDSPWQIWIRSKETPD